MSARHSAPTTCPAAPREYSTKAKNAQEAHEAVRPTDVGRTPASMARYLGDEQRRLYELIWKRAVASQMQSAELDQVSVEIAEPPAARLRATGSIVAFDGFLKLYREGRDDAAGAGAERGQPHAAADAERDPLKRGAVDADQHFTQPPPRFSEASLVKKMEELGIGRPSTYASILTVLRDRDYVRHGEQALRAGGSRPPGHGVPDQLLRALRRSGFTAGLEEQLDDISDGRADWRDGDAGFWDEFSHAVEQTRDLKISDVIDALDADLGQHFFPTRADGTDPRLLHRLRHGPARPEARPLRQLHRLLQLPGLPVHPPARGRWQDGEGGETLKEGVAPARRPSRHRRGRSPSSAVPTASTCSRASPIPADKKAKPRRTSLPQAAWRATASRWSRRWACCRCRASSGIHPELGSRSRPASAASGPT